MILIILYLGQNCLFSFVCPACMFAVWVSVLFVCRCVLCWTNRGLVKLWVFIPNSLQIQTNSQSLLIHSYPSLACYLFNKLFNSIACLLYFINLQLVIPGRTWILLYLGRTVYKRLWACLALYIVNKYQCYLFTMCSFFNNIFTVTGNNNTMYSKNRIGNRNWVRNQKNLGKSQLYLN